MNFHGDLRQIASDNAHSDRKASSDTAVAGRENKMAAYGLRHSDAPSTGPDRSGAQASQEVRHVRENRKRPAVALVWARTTCARFASSRASGRPLSAGRSAGGSSRCQTASS